MAKKPFHQLLGDIRAGELNDELTAKMTELVAAVQNTNKAGSLTLKIKLTPTKGLALEIEDDVSINKPTLSKPSTLLFPTVEGNLQTNNPLQKSLDLKVVQDGGATQFNSVGMGQPQNLVSVPGASNTQPAGTGTDGQ